MTITQPENKRWQEAGQKKRANSFSGDQPRRPSIGFHKNTATTPANVSSNEKKW